MLSLHLYQDQLNIEILVNFEALLYRDVEVYDSMIDLILQEHLMLLNYKYINKFKFIIYIQNKLIYIVNIIAIKLIMCMLAINIYM